MRKHRWKMLLLLLFSVTLIGCSEKRMVKFQIKKNYQSDYIDISREGYKSELVDFSVPFMECHILRILRRIQPFQSVINRIAAIFPIMRMQRLPAMPQKVPTIYFHIKGSYME